MCRQSSAITCVQAKVQDDRDASCRKQAQFKLALLTSHPHQQRISTMRASASSCICRIVHPQLPAIAPNVRPSTSSSLLFQRSLDTSRRGPQQQQRQASSKAGEQGGGNASDGQGFAAEVAARDAKELEQWLKSEDGQRYKRPVPGRSNWIGRTVSALALLLLLLLISSAS